MGQIAFTKKDNKLQGISCILAWVTLQGWRCSNRTRNHANTGMHDLGGACDIHEMRNSYIWKFKLEV